ncbi:MAG: transposase [Bacillota bacterium]|nr:transposase [Bacillota bacterium]
MPRKAREKSSNDTYHIMLRGINKQTIFEDDEDKTRFLNTLKRYKEISKYQLYGYCLMDNHIHLLIKELEEPISESIKRISSSYVYWYNMKYERCGHLFQERFKSENVESIVYFLTVLRYIHQNPVKAGLAKNVFECEWTSINEYLHKVKIVDIDKVLCLFSPYRASAIKLFVNYMKKPSDDQCLDFKVKVRITDSEVIEYLHKLGIKSVSLLQQMEKENRDTTIAMLKELNGVTVRQLSRITGISKSTIQRIR